MSSATRPQDGPFYHFTYHHYFYPNTSRPYELYDIRGSSRRSFTRTPTYTRKSPLSNRTPVLQSPPTDQKTTNLEQLNMCNYTQVCVSKDSASYLAGNEADFCPFLRCVSRENSAATTSAGSCLAGVRSTPAHNDAALLTSPTASTGTSGCPDIHPPPFVLDDLPSVICRLAKQ